MTPATLPLPELKRAFLEARGWSVKRTETYGAPSFNMLSDGAYTAYCEHAEELAWQAVPVTLDMILGPGGAMDELNAAGYTFDIGHKDVKIYYGVGVPLRIPGPPSEALSRAIMNAYVMMKQENTNGN